MDIEEILKLGRVCRPILEQVPNGGHPPGARLSSHEDIIALTLDLDPHLKGLEGSGLSDDVTLKG